MLLGYFSFVACDYHVILLNFLFPCLTAYSSAFYRVFLPCLSVIKPISQACSLLNIGLVTVFFVVMCCPCGLFVMCVLIFLLFAYLNTLITSPFCSNQLTTLSKQCSWVVFNSLSKVPRWSKSWDFWLFTKPINHSQCSILCWALSSFYDKFFELFAWKLSKYLVLLSELRGFS